MHSTIDLKNQLSQTIGAERLVVYQKLLSLLDPHSKEWETTAQQAYDYANKLNDPSSLFEIALKLAECGIKSGNAEISKHYLSICYKQAKAQQDPYWLSRYHLTYGHFCLANNYLLQAKSSFLQAEKLILEINNPRGLIIIYNNLAVTFSKLSQHDYVIQYLEKSLEFLNQFTDWPDIEIIYNNIAGAYQEKKDYAQAQYYLEKALEKELKHPNPHLRSSIYLNLGNNYRLQGQHEPALSHLFKSLEIAQTVHYQLDIANTYLSIAKTYQEMEDFDEAYKFAMQGHTLIQEMPPTGLTEDSYLLLAQLHKARNEYEQAYQCLWEHQIIHKEEFEKVYLRQIETFSLEFETSEKEIYRLQNIELGQANQKLNDALKEIQIKENKLNELNQTKDLVFSIISHDLRNATATIGGNIDLILHGLDLFPKDKIRKMMKNMRNAADHSSFMLCNVMKLLNLHTGRLSFKPKSIHVHQLIHQEIESQTLSIERKQLFVDINIAKPLHAHYDPHFFSIIFRNLLNNAIKFTPVGEKIRIFAEILNAKIYLSIQNDGEGIPSNLLKSLFVFHSHKSRKGTAGESGSGLGLVFCKQFIEKSGETISAESVEGEGTTFTFSMKSIT